MRFKLTIVDDIESGTGRVPSVETFNVEAGSIPLGLLRLFELIVKSYGKNFPDQ